MLLKKFYTEVSATHSVFGSRWILRMTIPLRWRWWILSRSIWVAGHLRVRGVREDQVLSYYDLGALCI